MSDVGTPHSVAKSCGPCQRWGIQEPLFYQWGGWEGHLDPSRFVYMIPVLFLWHSLINLRMKSTSHYWIKNNFGNSNAFKELGVCCSQNATFYIILNELGNAGRHFSSKLIISLVHESNHVYLLQIHTAVIMSKTCSSWDCSAKTFTNSWINQVPWSGSL